MKPLWVWGMIALMGCAAGCSPPIETNDEGAAAHDAGSESPAAETAATEGRGDAAAEEGTGMDRTAPRVDPSADAWRPGPHLFIDDALIAESEGLARTTHQPLKYDGPVIPKGPKAWHEWPLFFLRVLPDPESDGLRIWYNIRNNAEAVKDAGAKTAYAYATSHNGVDWQRDPLGLIEVLGEQTNLYRKSANHEFGMFLVDEGPDFANPARRYKFAWDEGGIKIAFSPDGLNFTPHPTDGIDDMGDIIDGCWDPLRRRYIAITKAHSRPEDGYKGSTDNAKEGYRRLVGQSESKDFIHWSPLRRIVVADPKEPGVWEFYGMVPRVRGELYIGFLRVLRDDLPAIEGGPVKGIGWTELCTSRDGENWTRWREPFLDRNPQEGTFDHAMAWFGDIVTFGDRELIYYGGYSEGHKIGLRQIGAARLRKNGFVSRYAGNAGGRLITPPRILDAGKMTVNAKVGGELRARLLDGQGQSYPGFGFDDCTPIRGDSVAHPITWRVGLDKLRGKPVSFEFQIANCRLFGFDLTNAE